MLEEIAASVRALCLLTPLFLLLELLLPGGESKPYVRFVFGLVEIGLLLRPALRLLTSLS